MLTPLRAMTLLGFIWLLPVSEIAEARGPRGGGGRAVGGFSRGGPSGPSFAAPSGRINSPAAGHFSGGQFNGSQINSGPRSPATVRSQADVQQFLSGQTRPAGAAQQQLQAQQRNGQHAANAQSALQNFQHGPEPFSPAWYAEHPQAWQYTHPHADAVAVASAAAVTGWLAYGAYPYPAATSTTVVYESTGEPTSSESTTPAPTTTQPATSEWDAAASPSDATPEWLPLGAYRLSPTVGAVSAQSVQLSLAQDGELRGVYFDELSGTTQNVVGRVDGAAGQAEWTLENSSAHFSTTVNDLTQPTGTVQVLLPGGQQTWTLTRADGS